MMEIPAGNFFEVTINSNKLYTFMEDISKQIQVQQAKMEQIAKSTAIITNQRLKKHQQIMQLQLEKIRKSKQQDVNYLKLFIKDVDKKNEQKHTTFQNTFVMLNNRMNDMKTSFQEDIALKISYLEKLILNNKDLDKMEQKYDKIVNSINQKIDNIQHKFGEVQVSLDKNVMNHQQLFERFNRSQSEHQTQKSLKFIGRSKKKLMTQLKMHKNETYLENKEQMESIVTRLTQFQQSFKKSLLANNRIIKINDGSTFQNIDSTRQKEIQKGQFQSKVFDELAKIKQYTIQRDDQIQKNIWKCNNKYQIFNQQLGIFSRKLEKDRLIYDQMKQVIKNNEDSKHNDRHLQSIKQLIKKVEKQFQVGLEMRLSKEQFETEKNKIIERLQIISDLTFQKAQKYQVRKGMMFLEQRIKEIILVIAEDKNLIKDSATTKIILKCLSCNKDLDCLQSQQQAKCARNSATNSMRSSTNQLRKRVRINNRSVVDENDF